MVVRAALGGLGADEVEAEQDAPQRGMGVVGGRDEFLDLAATRHPAASCGMGNPR